MNVCSGSLENPSHFQISQGKLNTGHSNCACTRTKERSFSAILPRGKAIVIKFVECQQIFTIFSTSMLNHCNHIFNFLSRQYKYY